jgi:TPR repeat protein
MSRFWTLHSSFRLNVFVAGIALLITGVGVYANAIFNNSHIEQALSLQENARIKIRAQDGDANAALQVGMNYISGGKRTNFKEAAKWLELAARRDNTDAQYYLGMSLLTGQGVIQDYRAGFFWVDKAAHKGHPEAQLSLGKMYRRGTGVEVDRALAYMWFNLAAAQGIPDAAKNRDSIADHLSLEEILAMQEEAHRIDDMSDASKPTQHTLLTNPNKISIE